jgi:hypothetical protein
MGISWPARAPLAYQEKLFSMKSVGGLVTVLILVIATLEAIIPYRSFETTNRFHLQGPRAIQNSSILIYFAAEAWNHALLVDRIVGEIQFLIILGRKIWAKMIYIYIYGQRKTIQGFLHKSFPWYFHTLMMATCTGAETLCSKTLQCIKRCGRRLNILTSVV